MQSFSYLDLYAFDDAGANWRYPPPKTSVIFFTNTVESDVSTSDSASAGGNSSNTSQFSPKN